LVVVVVETDVDNGAASASPQPHATGQMRATTGTEHTPVGIILNGHESSFRPSAHTAAVAAVDVAILVVAVASATSAAPPATPVVWQPHTTGQTSRARCDWQDALIAALFPLLGHRILSTRPSGHDGCVVVVVEVLVLVVSDVVTAGAVDHSQPHNTGQKLRATSEEHDSSIKSTLLAVGHKALSIRPSEHDVAGVFTVAVTGVTAAIVVPVVVEEVKPTQPQRTGQKCRAAASMHISATSAGSPPLGHNKLSALPSGHA
jgi:hypothetical protein